MVLVKISSELKQEYYSFHTKTRHVSQSLYSLPALTIIIIYWIYSYRKIKVLNILVLKIIIMFENNKLEVRQVDQNNKGLFAKSSFRGWETILDCEPICVSTSIKNRNKYCSFCLLEKQVSRCSQCKVPYYCSKDCQKEDWKYHKFECPGLKKIEEKNLDPSKINMEILLNIKLWIMKQKNTQIRSKVSQMCHLIQFQTPQRLKQFQETSVMLAELLLIERNEANLSQLIKQQSIVSLNSFTIQDYLCNQQSIGIGLYWPVNFINHHCHPNSTQVFDGRYIKIIANRQIQMKEEISISYMPILGDLKEKQKICRDGYLFECFCQQCQVNKMFNQSLIYLKCPKCHNATIIDKSKKKLKEGKSEENQGPKEGELDLIQCTSCNQKLQITLLSQTIDNVNNLLGILSKPDANYDKLKKALIQLRKLISENDPRLKECINRCYLESLEQAQKDPKIYSQSYILLKEMINLYPKWYRMNPQDEIPYVFVWKYAQLGKLAYNLSKLKKACQYTQKAYEIIQKIKFRNSFTEVKELKERYGQMKVGLSFNKAQLFKGRG